MELYFKLKFIISEIFGPGPGSKKISGPGPGPDKIEILDPDPGLPDGLYRGKSQRQVSQTQPFLIKFQP